MVNGSLPFIKLVSVFTEFFKYKAQHKLVSKSQSGSSRLGIAILKLNECHHSELVMSDPGNSLSTAQFIAINAGSQTYSDTVGTANPDDYYRFTWSGRSSVNLTLSALNANMDLQLLGSSGTVLQQASNTGTAAETVNLTDLSAGVYYVRVFAAESTYLANYTLSLQAQQNIKTDLLWRNYTTGEDGIWTFNGTSVASTAYIQTTADLNWELVGAGSFTGQGQTDLVWRNNTTGQNAIWQMNGTTLVTSLALTPLADSHWRVASVADWNGDGHADLLWRNVATGANMVWQMQGTTSVATLNLPPVTDLNWQLVGSGDFNHDGQADLVWRNQSTGANVVWQLQGTTLQTAVFFQIAEANWHIEGVADFNGDDHPDLVWRNYATGENAIWLLNGTTLLPNGDVYFTRITDVRWQIGASFNSYGNPGVIDTAGNTAATAFDLGTLIGEGNYSDSVSSVDDDYYKFTLFTNSTVGLALNGATATSNIVLSGSGMEPVTGIEGGGRMVNVSLSAGTYYIRVYQPESTSSAYSPKVAAALDLVGDTLGTARDIATGVPAGWVGSVAFADAIGRTDKDYYHFDLAQISTISLGITDSLAAASMTLIQDINANGVKDVGESVLSFSSTGTFTKTGTLRAGSYFIEIVPNLSVAVAGSLFDYKISLKFLDYDISVPLLVPYIGGNQARDTRRRPANVIDFYNRNVQFEIVSGGGLNLTTLKEHWQPKQTWVILHGWNAD